MGVDRDGAVRRAELAVAERVVEVLVGVDDTDDLPGAEAAYVLDHRARGGARGVRVDHEQASITADERDVDVEPRVAGHPHPVGDLLEPGIGGGTHVPEASTIGTKD